MAISLESQVVSLELSKRLKELGVKQEDSLHAWIRCLPREQVKWVDHNLLDTHAEYFVSANFKEWSWAGWQCAAFTVAELGQWLPTTIDNRYKDCTLWINMRNMHHSNDTHQYCVWYENARPEEKIEIVANTEANARAKCLIYLIEKGIVKP